MTQRRQTELLLNEACWKKALVVIYVLDVADLLTARPALSVEGPYFAEVVAVAMSPPVVVVSGSNVSRSTITDVQPSWNTSRESKMMS